MNHLNLFVCPHDTATAPERWFRFTQYLNQQLDLGIHMKISLDFNDFHDNLAQADLVYANPADTIKLVTERKFIPLVRPANLYDEVVFVASATVTQPSLAAIAGADLSSVKSMLVTKVGLNCLQKQGVVPNSIHDQKSWLGVIHSVCSGEANFGLVYRDTYRSMAPKTRDMVQAFYTSDEQVAFHALLLNPDHSVHQERLKQALLSMKESPNGQSVLAELGIEAWWPLQAEQLEPIQQLVAA